MKNNRVIEIVPKFSRKQVEVFVRREVQKIEAAILSRLLRIGENFIKNARSLGNYKDQTGNLRSSIGYVIMKDGEQISISFPGKSSVGSSQGKTIAEKLKRKYSKTKGMVLICIAGMEYAAAVESRGKDVITGSTIIAKEELKKAIKSIQDKVNKK